MRLVTPAPCISTFVASSLTGEVPPGVNASNSTVSLSRDLVSIAGAVDKTPTIQLCRVYGVSGVDICFQAQGMPARLQAEGERFFAASSAKKCEATDLRSMALFLLGKFDVVSVENVIFQLCEQFSENDGMGQVVLHEEDVYLGLTAGAFRMAYKMSDLKNMGLSVSEVVVRATGRVFP
ncbi:MAG: hypothetical protein COX62_05230 [Deltaproteobacteria bacterium CG_4_10_14_0_2_um_filter_43_8]|nr:MAG: hypothetical protein COV43_06490 [Deltaproteobacteria bacterium CG11_big_fil_rev_8_21_14_0_20_42_23]PJA20155.1 MAG: hypothetical protein COX62_05230 [Deltaproteobacteria bacterium CG_4_10_14_0_2_um_filter_43_8]PJC64074.1 MAG: hypothetical protein CO021_06185 [Deltaproteobacteria bacterium CG_4_9_14_0_2_um_filter_42_21]